MHHTKQSEQEEFLPDICPDEDATWRTSTFWFLAILLLSGASGLNANLLMMKMLGIWALAVVLPLLFFQRFLPGLLAQMFVMAATLGIIVLSGVGIPTEKTLGWPGFAGFHFLLLAYCAASLIGVLKRAADENNVDEAFLNKDLWIFNAAIACTTTYTFVLLPGHPFEKAYVLAALAKGILPLSGIVGLILLTRATRNARARRTSLLIALLAALLAIGLTGGRIALMYSKTQLAQDALEGRNIELADAASESALALARKLGFKKFEKESLQVRCTVLSARGKIDKALTEMATYLTIAYSSEEKPQILQEVEKYLKSFSKKNARKRIECAPDMIHAFFDRHPEELETILRIFLQNGNLAPLAERYAWAGFPEIADAGAFETDLLDAWTQNPESTSEAEFFLGVFYTHENRPNDAQRYLRKTQARFPGHFNSLVLLERNAALLNQSNTLQDFQKRERTYPPDPKAPDAPWTSALEDCTYAPLEINQGFYDISLSASLSTTSKIKNTQFAILINNTPLLLAIGPDDSKSYRNFVDIEKGSWKTVQFRQQFARSECVQLRLERTPNGDGLAQILLRSEKAEFTPQ